MSNEYPLVSVIANTYNHEQYCEASLDAIKNQTYPNLQLTIIDDCSQDNTVSIIDDWIQRNNYPCTFIKHEVNQGLIPSLNEGLNASKGLYYNLCSLDDISLPNKIELQVQKMQENPNALLVISDMLVINEKSEVIHESFMQDLMNRKEFPRENFIEEFFKSDFFFSPSYLCHSNFFKVTGHFDQNIMFEDFDKKLAILTKDVEFAIVEKPTIKYRILQNSYSNQSKKRYYLQNLATIKKYLNNSKVRPYLKNLLTKFSRLLLEEEKSSTTLKWLFFNFRVNKNKKSIKLLAKYFIRS
jgi:glycosyltransferase involved in cell wall biosynthesis